MAVLGDYIKVKHGYAFKGEFFSTDDNGVVLITPGNFAIGGGFKQDKCKFFTSTFSGDYVLHEDDLIVTMTDLSKNIDTLGYGALIPNSNRIYLHNQRIGLVQFLSDKLDKHYLYWFMRTDFYQKTIAGTSSGETVHHTSPDRICAVEISPPDIVEQTKIANILDNIENKIANNHRINKNLLQQAQALFISWFVDYEPFGGKMPDNWENMSVYELADYINGAAFKKNEYADTGLPIIKIAELKNGITDSTQRCGVKKDEKYYIDDRDILFSWSGNPDTSIDTFIWSMGRAILNQHTFRVVSKYDAPAFTFFLLKYLKPQFTHIASNKQTTGLGHVTVADLKRLQFRANASVIAEFNALVMPMFDLIYSKYKEIQQLSNLRDTLLPKLMSGEIDVSNLDL